MQRRQQQPPCKAEWERDAGNRIVLARAQKSNRRADEITRIRRCYGRRPHFCASGRSPFLSLPLSQRAAAVQLFCGQVEGLLEPFARGGGSSG